MVYNDLISTLGVEWLAEDVEVMIKVNGMNPNQVYHSLRNQIEIYTKYELDIVMTHLGCDYKNPSWIYNGPYYGSKFSMDAHKLFDRLRGMFS